MTYLATILADNPVSYYRLDESSGTAAADSSPLRQSSATIADSSGNSHAGSWPNSGDYVFPGGHGVAAPTADGAAMQFDGVSGYIVGATTGLQTGNGAWSMECFFYGTLTGAGEKVIMGFGTWGSGGAAPQMIWTGTQFGFERFGGSSAMATASANTWHHVVLTYDGTTLTTYIDGSSAATSTPGPLSVSLTNATVGDGVGGGRGYNVTGYVAECAWYNVKLTSTQVSNHYAARNNTGGSSYANTVIGDSPVTYYRLNDKGPLDTGTYTATGITYSATSLLTGDSDTAVTLNGTSGQIQGARKFTNPNPWSEECWFEVANGYSSGGALLGCADTTAGNVTRDRIVWMGADGKLHFTVHTGSDVSIASSSAYNDGQRHHVVATLGPTNGMVLYVDGASVASNGTQKTAQSNYAALHLAGNLDISAISGAPSSNFLAGTLDEVAFYAAELTSTQVSAHYTAGSAAFVEGSGSAAANAVVSASPAGVGPKSVAAQANATFSATGGVTSPTGAPTYSLLLGGVAVNLIAGSLDLTNQLGQRSQGRASVWSGPGLVYDYGTAVSVVDNLGNTVYTGFVVEDQMTLGGLYPKLIQHDLTIVDNHYLADKRLASASFLNEVAGVIVKALWQSYLAAEGVTLGPIANGVWVPEFVANYEPVSLQIDKLAAMSGFWWQIDENRVLWFQPYGAVPGPYTIDGTTIDQRQQFTVTTGNKDYRNRQVGVGGRDHTPVQTENFVGDSLRRTWTLRYPVSSLSGHDPKSGLTKGIYLNGVLQTNVANKSSGTEAEWEYAISDAVVAQYSSYTVLAPTDNLQVIYEGEYPVVAVAQNKAEIAIQRSKEGIGTGYVEARYANLKVHTLNAMFAIAQAQLGYYSQTMTTLVFATRNPGLAQGQTVTVNLPDFALNNRAMLVESVEITDSIDAINIWYIVTCVGSPYSVAQWQTFWTNLLNQDHAADADADNQNSGVAVAEVSQSQASWNWTGHTTPTVTTCHICGPSTLCGPAIFVC